MKRCLMVDIKKFPDIIDEANAIINNKGIAEIKIEIRNDKPYVVVVETSRRVRAKKPL